MTSVSEASWEQFYDGSRNFQFVADAMHLPIDQINFILGQLAAVTLSVILRTHLPSLTYSGIDSHLRYTAEEHEQRTTQRHRFAVASGLLLTYFCFGKQVLLAVALGAACYCLLLLLPATAVHKVTMLLCMTLLSLAHIYRQSLQQAVFVIDITGPMMLMVQRATTLAFALHDGRCQSKDKMTSLQAKNAITVRPSVLEYFSYLLSFQSILAGPFLLYRDYQDYIEGTDDFARAVVRHQSVEQAKAHQHLNNGISNGNGVIAAPVASSTSATVTPPAEVAPLNPAGASFRKLLIASVFALSTLLLVPRFPVTSLADASFLEFSFLKKVIMVLVCTTLVRHLYFTAWLLAEAACNMGGLGYSGTDSDGNHLWNGASNVDIMNVEFGSSLRTTLDGWNSKTMIWLRYAAYERLPKHKVIGTYFLSSIWHGFYPGYYTTFFMSALFTVSSRHIRRSIRPLVVKYQGGDEGPIMNCYHVVTWFATRLALSYTTFGFVMLRFWPTVTVYWNLYLYLHFLGAAGIYLVPLLIPPPKRAAKQAPPTTAEEQNNANNNRTDETCKYPLETEGGPMHRNKAAVVEQNGTSKHSGYLTNNIRSCDDVSNSTLRDETESNKRTEISGVVHRNKPSGLVEQNGTTKPPENQNNNMSNSNGTYDASKACLTGDASLERLKSL
uniref:Lysophospholipid acyltransferase 1 n=1 Tax=Hirondellea gigas TaxID=1518452 RepID=A0A2P2I1K5_9CRUS